ncbi:hypothetical protein SAMN05421847_0149 [Halpernia humi]|uniref:Uncharacterized protein n=1 Tax=Halpernia humi TaxID=493375 RepID=A0A1H5SHV6_9FLAO|nr:DUF6804 family protein [Halpernia humi]SEF50030.1 hypothetical protein SAMN05421847_0149 [Halpernia humi]
MKNLSLICALSCFIAVFNLPIEYYTFLRILVSLGAGIMLLKNYEEKNLFFYLFLFVLILFNPIIPVYLYVKSFWIPTDIAVGILFLVVFNENKNPEREDKLNTKNKNLENIKPHDKIIPPKQ